MGLVTTSGARSSEALELALAREVPTYQPTCVEGRSLGSLSRPRVV